MVYSILEHPADLGIEARGRSLREAFEEAAVALTSIIVDIDSVSVKVDRDLTVDAGDIESLLVRWLSELLYLYDGEGFLCKEATVRQFSPTRLDATIRGEPLSEGKHRMRTDVKAVTYHQLLVREDENGGYVRVYLDI
ncbi:MAG TPA: archease [Bacteroidota bacterium]